MIWLAFAILSTLVAILYAWVWQLSSCHNQLSRRVWKDEAPPRPMEPAPTYVTEKWSYDIAPNRQPVRNRAKKPVKKTVRKNKKERAKWDR